jgi:hypothetical protein
MKNKFEDSALTELQSKHKQIVGSYKNTKSIHLERLGSKMLKNEEKFQMLKGKKIEGKFLKKF